MKKTLQVFVAILICEAAGIIGSFFTAPAIGGWYQGLAKPSFNPPAWIFGPVWTILYALMGIALYLLWKKKAKAALILFGIQLVLNTLWSIVFFGLKNPQLAFVEILFLWLFILLTMQSSWRYSREVVYLLLPYWLWVSFAAVLNYSLWQLSVS